MRKVKYGYQLCQINLVEEESQLSDREIVKLEDSEQLFFINRGPGDPKCIKIKTYILMISKHKVDRSTVR